jgi:hypothetical protein
MSLATCAIAQMEESERRGTYGFSLTSKKDVWQLRTVSETARLNWITSLRSQQGTCESLPCAPLSHPTSSFLWPTA